MPSYVFKEGVGQLFDLSKVNLPRDLTDQIEEMIGHVLQKLLKEGGYEVYCAEVFRGEPENLSLEHLGSLAGSVEAFRLRVRLVVRETFPADGLFSSEMIEEKLQGLLDWSLFQEQLAAPT